MGNYTCKDPANRRGLARPLCRSSVLPSVRESASPANPASCAAVLHGNSGRGERCCAFSLCQESKGHLLHPILPRSSTLRPRLARASAPNASLCNLRIHHLALPVRVQSHSGLAALASLLSPPRPSFTQPSCQAWRPSAGIMLSATMTSQNVDVTQPAVTRSYSVSSSASVSRLWHADVSCVWLASNLVQ